MGLSNSMIKGITVTLISLVQTGTDAFNAPVYAEEEITVDNVLVAPASSDDVIDSTSMYGKKAVYTIAVPKGDSNIWENNIVVFFGERWRVFSLPMMGIEDNIPLNWNAKYYVERYA